MSDKPSFSFYHLSKSSIEEALPKLIEKILATGEKAVLKFNNLNLLKRIDEVLWSVGGTRFIPHCREDEEDKELQAAYLTTKDENPNNSSFLINIGEVDGSFFTKFTKNILVFSNFDEGEMLKARDLWKKLKSENNHELKYFLQDDKGNWAIKE